MAVKRPEYLGLPRAAERQAWLLELSRRKESLALPLVSDLLCLDLPATEKRQLLQVADTSDQDAFEEFVLSQFLGWDHDLQVAGLASWSVKSPRRHWRRLLEIAPERLPESVFAFLVENAWNLGGRALLAHLAPVPEPEQLPGVTQAVLLRRLTQWSLLDEGCMRMAERTVLKTVETGCPASPATVFATEYIARFVPENLSHLVSNPLSPKYWSDHMQCLFLSVAGASDADRDAKALLAKPPADDVEFYRRFFKIWPPVWVRPKLSTEVLAKALTAVTTRPTKDTRGLPASRAVTWELFAGVAPETLAAALAAVPAASVPAVEALLGSLLPTSKGEQALSKTPALISDDPTRTSLFDLLYRGPSKTVDDSSTVPSGPNGRTWKVLLETAQGKKAQTKDVIVAGRSLPAVFQQAFFDVLEKQSGNDDYLPPLVDQLHSSEPGLLGAAVGALVGIGTGQALTQAVRVLGLKTASFDVKFELCERLSGRDLAGCQAELREIINDQARGAVTRTSKDVELMDAMRSLLAHDALKPNAPAARASSHDSGDLDKDLRKYVPGLDQLPREVVRALRTARLLGKTLAGDGREGIDISPTVDLQYKGLEILFRQTYGPGINQLVQAGSGILQRKLDLIGYGRAGRGRLEAFETYVISLPVVADIPQFSRFKLSKLLQTIALHRPGKRFGLDGLKAFAIFMIVFGRRQCEYGLERLYPVGFATDRELLEFCRDLNMLQDIRNRAVHEGLAPGFYKEAEALWSLTGSLIGRSIAGLAPG